MTRKRSWILLSVLLLATGAGNLAASGSSGGVDPNPAVEVREHGLRVVWHAARPVFLPESDGTIRIQVAGLGHTSEPGSPEMPVDSLLVALPPGAEPRLSVGRLAADPLLLPGSLARSPWPQSGAYDAEGNPVGSLDEQQELPVSFRAQPVELQVLGTVRGVRLARLSFYPVLVDGAQTKWVRQVEATIDFGPAAPDGVEMLSSHDPIIDTLRAMVANPKHVLPMRSPAGAGGRSADQPWNPDEVVLVEVRERGLTAVTYDDLANAGFPVDDVDPRKLQLVLDGTEIALQWEGDGDSQFEEDERILFFSAPRFSRYTWNDVYYLWEGLTAGLRMQSRSADPAGASAGRAWHHPVAEVNDIYTPELLYGRHIPAGRDGDRWVWRELSRPGTTAGSFDIALDTVDPAQPGELTVWLIGTTDEPPALDHRVDASLNGTPLGRIEWDGRQAVEWQLTVPAHVLHLGVNRVDLSLPGITGLDQEKVWLDAFQLSHARGPQALQQSLEFCGETVPSAYSLQMASVQDLRGYQITDPRRPVILTSVQVAGNQVSLRDPVGVANQCYHLLTNTSIHTPISVRRIRPLLTKDVSGADYLMIAPVEFMPSLNRLVALRAAQGLHVEVEDVAAIYDAYGDGRVDPAAIRAYLAETFATWEPVPVFVLLVGDGTSDPKQYRPNSLPTRIPPYLLNVDLWAGESAADHRYVEFDGGGDLLPDMLIGRLPVNSAEELETVISKIAHYEIVPPPGEWNRETLFIADDPDGGGDFETSSESIAAQFIAPPYTATRVYYSPPVSTVLGTREAIRNSWDDGVGLIVYNGHASVHFWAAEVFMHLNEIPDLTNHFRLPMVIEMTCLTSAFHVPGYATFDEALVRHPSGGVIASWGSTGLGLNAGHQLLAEGFLQRVFTDGEWVIGPATLAGKLKLMTEAPGYGSLVETFTLLGDPATTLQLQPTITTRELYLPVAQR